jgi:hypothetical protein
MAWDAAASGGAGVIELRPYQHAAIAEIRQAYRIDGHR